MATMLRSCCQPLPARPALMRLAGVLLAGLMAGDAGAAASRDDWADETCAVKTQARWCAPRLEAGGWKLKYRSTNPADLVDVFWVFEVWIKGRDALVCELKGGRNGLRSNGCYSAIEVD